MIPVGRQYRAMSGCRDCDIDIERPSGFARLKTRVTRGARAISELNHNEDAPWHFARTRTTTNVQWPRFDSTIDIRKIL